MLLETKQEGFLNKINKIRQDIQINEKDYINVQSDISCICVAHKHHFKMKAKTLLGGCGSCYLCNLSKEDITGNRYGKLTVFEFDENMSLDKKRSSWKCKCDCGNIVSVTKNNLISGNSKSCGCVAPIKTTIRNQSNIKNNDYEFYDLYVKGKLSNSDSYFYIDNDDFEVVNRYCWHVSTGGYAETIERGSRKRISMHRLIMSIEDKETEVDHINHNKLDNRKSNLRPCKNSENGKNKKIMNTNISGEIGVSYKASLNKWQASITSDCKRIYLGVYSDFDDAVKARKEAEKKYFGEFAYNPDAPRIEVS